MSKEQYRQENCSDNSPVLFSQAVCIRFDENDPFCMKIAQSCCQFDEREINIRRKGRKSDLSPFNLPEKYSRKLKINKQKLKDIKSLFNYIPISNQGFFQALEADDSDGNCVEDLD